MAVDYWHALLDTNKRQWLYEARMLTDETIDQHRIGWRPDLKAYSIPFWRGYPGESEVDIVQFRSTEDSPTLHGKSWKYIGLTGHNRPSLVNPDVVNPVFVVMFFGTLDAILARQDGLPAVSANGVSVFLQGAHALRLKDLIGKPKYLIIVPDTTSSELLPTYRTAQFLNASTAFLPFDVDAKDYTDYRLAGGTVESFMADVLGIDSPFVDEAKAGMVLAILDSISRGDIDQTAKCVRELEVLPLNPLLVNHTLQLYLYQSVRFYPVPVFKHALTDEEVNKFTEELQTCFRYPELYAITRKWAGMVHGKSGGF